MMRLKIYDVSLEVVGDVALVVRDIQQVDPDLARQLRRASTSVPLNLAEGVHSRGGNENVRFQSAMASARETLAAIEVSVAARYIGAEKVDVLIDKLDRIVATLWKLIHQR